MQKHSPGPFGTGLGGSIENRMGRTHSEVSIILSMSHSAYPQLDITTTVVEIVLPNGASLRHESRKFCRNCLALAQLVSPNKGATKM